VLEDKPGNCPKCGMQLKPIRLDLRYACPVHQTYIQKSPGVHSYDGRELVPVTVSVFWTCGEERFLEPGKCGDGSARKEQYEQRPHGDHNPKHGGQFFMAPDAWHHLEGTYPSANLFRLYFYNDYSKPLTPTGFTATLSVLDANDKELPGLTNLPLKRGRISNTMEVALPKNATATMPLRLLARVKFTPTAQPNPFNFTFNEVTKEPTGTPAPTAVTTMNMPGSGGVATAPNAAASSSSAAAPKPSAAAGTPASASTPATASTATAATPPATPPAASGATTSAAQPTAAAPSTGQTSADASNSQANPFSPQGGLQMEISQAPAALVAALDESVLPNNVPGLVAELSKRAGEVEQMVKEGNLGQVWLPAMGTKTVALALESHASTLPEPQRAAATVAVKRVVTSAWDLDAYGDLGDKQRMTEAYTKLAAAVAELKAVYGSR
jgi:hypothetical protein